MHRTTNHGISEGYPFIKGQYRQFQVFSQNQIHEQGTALRQRRLQKQRDSRAHMGETGQMNCNNIRWMNYVHAVLSDLKYRNTSSLKVHDLL